MPSREVTIVNKLGLHARAAAKLVTTASGFGAEIKLRRGDREVNGKSIMGVMMLAASKGVELELEIDGADERACRDAIVTLIADRFGEGE